MRRHPSLNINRYPEQDDAHDESGDDVIGGPTMRCMRSIGDRKDQENESRHSREHPPKVHLGGLSFGFWRRRVSSWKTEQGGWHAQEDDDRSEPEVPPPREEVARHSANNDAKIKSQRGKCAVQTENEVLARTGAVRLAQDHDTRRQESGGAETLHGAGDDEHGVVLAKPCDDSPYQEPGETKIEDEIAPKNVGYAAKG